ncbi:MAG: WD40 repeat domain-containing protein, partial [Deltaproteobacteria bacterium]
VTASAAFGQNERQKNEREVFNPRPSLLALDFSRDGTLVVTGGDAVRVHDLISGEQLNQFAFRATTRTVAFSSQEKRIFAAAGDDGTIRFWRVPEEKPFRVLETRPVMIRSIAFSPAGTLLASGGNGEYRDGQFVPDKPAFGEFTLWNAGTGKIVRTLTFPRFNVGCVAFSRNGKRLALAKNSADRNMASIVEVYEIEPWKHVRSVAFSPGFALSISFLPDGRQILIAGGDCVPMKREGCMTTGKFWLAGPDAKEATELVEPTRHGYFRGAGLTAAGDRFVTGTVKANLERRGTSVAVMQMRDTKTGKPIWSHAGEGYDIYGAKLFPDGKRAACCIGSEILILDAETGELVRTIEAGK